MFLTARMRAILDRMEDIFRRYDDQGFFPAYTEHDAKRIKELSAQYWEAKQDAGL